MTPLLILEALSRGELDPREAAARLGIPEAPLVSATSAAEVDLDRARRCGFPEVVFAPGKTSHAIIEILKRLHESGQDGFVTRASPEQAADVLAALPDTIHNPVARTLSHPGPHGTVTTPQGLVVVITAGTGDLPVAEEALETARWMGTGVDLIVDVGVAGPHRLPAQRHRFLHADAIVVVAGMEGALPSVVGGHVSCPVIAVPTSIGYGASFGGLAALLGMLNSCAANVTVVNIDAGFKAGYVAAVIARRVAAARSAVT